MKIMRMTCCLIAAASVLLTTANGLSGQRSDDIQVEVTHLRGSVYRLQARGMNMAVSAGPDGLLLVDHFNLAPEKIRQALDKLERGKVRMIINTHHHIDHTGGNPIYGDQAAVIAHANARSAILEAYTQPSDYLPRITFTDSISVFFNGEEIRLYHLPEGHTEGDTAVYFTASCEQ